jgi:hypothetical protein
MTPKSSIELSSQTAVSRGFASKLQADSTVRHSQAYEHHDSQNDDLSQLY